MTDQEKKPIKKPLTLSKKLDLKDLENRSQSGGQSGKTVVVEVKKGRAPAKKPRFEEQKSTRMRAMKVDISGSAGQETPETKTSDEELAAQEEALRNLTEEERSARLKALREALQNADEEQQKERERIQRELEAAESFQKRKEQEKASAKAAEKTESESQKALEEGVDDADDLASKEALLESTLKEEQRHKRYKKEDVAGTADEEEGDATTKRYSVASERAAKPSKRPQPPKRLGEGRRTGKLTVSQALSGDGDEVRVRSIASIRRARAKERNKQEESNPLPQQKIVREVILPETISVQELSNRMAERSADVIKVLMKMGMMVTITQSIDADTAELVVSEFGHKVKRVSDDDIELELLKVAAEKESEGGLEPRAPVVTVMGHVDHGKTSLLDALRATDVVKGEAGGITQHIGAYQVTLESGQKITFIDTPGHAAFTEMRARGANATDIVILVVAADDGVKDQTIEAIKHAKAAEVPIVVAVNKIDKPEANADKVKTELLQHEIILEDLGGDILYAEVSAKQKLHLDKLEEAILLQAEMLDLQANPHRSAEGVVIEARLEKGRGPVATVLVQKGTLKVGSVFVAGSQWGRVRALVDDHGSKVDAAGPSMPVEVIGFDGAPQAGDHFVVVEDEARAREVAAFRDRKRREKIAAMQEKEKMANLFSASQDGGQQTLSVIIKSDVQGSAEAIASSLKKLENEEVNVKVVYTGVGGISESDISLARTANALVVGFNVRASNQAREMAMHEGIEIRYYSIIYDVINDAKAILSGMLSPTLQENFIGRAEVRQTFKVSKVGTIAGCYVIDGVVKKGSKVRLIRDDVVVHEGNLKTLKRFKEEVKDVKEGFECGMAFESYQDVREGDIIECSEILEIQRSL